MHRFEDDGAEVAEQRERQAAMAGYVLETVGGVDQLQADILVALRLAMSTLNMVEIAYRIGRHTEVDKVDLNIALNSLLEERLVHAVVTKSDLTGYEALPTAQWMSAKMHSGDISYGSR